MAKVLGKTRIVFLHGNLGRGSDWGDVVARIGGELSIEEALPDLWDFFDSGAESLEEWLFPRAGDDEPVFLVGYSMGGRLALQMLAGAPDRYAGAAIISGHPGLRNAGDRRQRLEKDRAWARIVMSDWDGFCGAWNGQEVFRGTSGFRLSGGEALHSRREAIAKAFDAWSLGRQQDLRVRLRKMETPVLWITGERDGRFGDLAADVAIRMPCAEHRVIADAGHRVLLDQPERLASVIVDWIKRVS